RSSPTEDRPGGDDGQFLLRPLPGRTRQDHGQPRARPRRMTAGPSPLTTVPRPREDREQEVLAPMRWRDATVGGQDTTGLSLVLPCTEDPELFFAESPQDVEQAKAMCRGCRARLACLAGALERREPWGVWGGELLMHGAIVPRKRPRGRPRKVVTIGVNAWATAVD